MTPLSSHPTSHRNLPVILTLFACLILAACATPATPSPLPLLTASPLPLFTSSPTPPTPTAPPPTRTPSPEPTATPTKTPTSTPDTRPLPRQWRTWPIVPTLSPNMIPVFLDGLAKGNDPYGFSTVGDCQSEPPVFMGIYSTEWYNLTDEYAYLQETIDFFSQSDSFARQSYCVQNGLSVASALSPEWANKTDCLPDETPLACDLRLHKPSLMFINLGTNWAANSTTSHERYLRQIVDILLENGVIPILSTKGDNVEGDWSINESIAQVAYDYDIPLWNFWASIQDLVNFGLDPDRPGGNYLTTTAWDRRSFTGLAVLDEIRKTLEPYYP